MGRPSRALDRRATRLTSWGGGGATVLEGAAVRAPEWSGVASCTAGGAAAAGAGGGPRMTLCCAWHGRGDCAMAVWLPWLSVAAAGGLAHAGGVWYTRAARLP